MAIDFQDTGTGMTQEQRRRAFTSLLITTKQKGAGLGLAIVGRVVDTHRGRVKLLPGRKGGTIVSIVLPVR